MPEFVTYLFCDMLNIAKHISVVQFLKQVYKPTDVLEVS